jgi:hypothetical protein
LNDHNAQAKGVGLLFNPTPASLPGGTGAGIQNRSGFGRRDDEKVKD